MIKYSGVIVFFRQMKAWLNGKTPCSFEYAHGHDFRVLSVKRFGGGTYATLVCSVCGKRATVDSFCGLEIDP